MLQTGQETITKREIRMKTDEEYIADHISHSFKGAVK